MKCDNHKDAIHKQVIIIGNGPSGIALSYMLSGNIPYIVSNEHPDEMLEARLGTCSDGSLVHQDLQYLANGLEGRSTNPVSLLLDSLTHPCADIGLEMEPLIEWRKNGVEIDHMVFGKGPPGGSWHSMDPHILTLSLGTWMALPGLKFETRDGAEKRAFAHSVATYYEKYVKEMGLTKYFSNSVIVTHVQPLYTDEKSNEPSRSTEETDILQNNWVQKIYDDVSDRIKFCTQPEIEVNVVAEKPKQGTCPFTSALNFILSRTQRRSKTERCCKRKYESTDSKTKALLAICHQSEDCSELANSRDVASDVVLQRKETKLSSNCDKNRSVSFSCDYDNLKNVSDNLYCKTFKEGKCFSNLLKNSCSLDLESKFIKVPKISSTNSKQCSFNSVCDPTTSNVNMEQCKTYKKPKWLLEIYDVKTGRVVNYTCNYLVLANGSSDLPNRLVVSNEKRDPNWLLHDVRSLEIELNLYVQYNNVNPDPVLVVGAGLSAADAIIVTRGKNVPVLHVFRNKSADLSKQLPENMYPEYHKVHQMMQDGGSTYPLYTALPEYTLTDYSESKRTVTLTSKDGKDVQYQISFAVVLIGSRPDLSFLPECYKLGVNKDINVDAKTNPVNINKLNHSINNVEGLYAIGPIAGDHFVRFIPGGALAIVSDLYKKYGY